MKTTTISVTEAARNFADCVNPPTVKTSRLYCSGKVPRFPDLVPDDEKVCSGRDLALVLDKTQLPEDDQTSHGFRTHEASLLLGDQALNKLRSYVPAGRNVRVQQR